MQMYIWIWIYGPLEAPREAFRTQGWKLLDGSSHFLIEIRWNVDAFLTTFHRGVTKQHVKCNEKSLYFRFIFGAVAKNRPAERGGGRKGHCPGARRHRGCQGSELSGLECKIHQLKLRPADAMMFFFGFGPKFEHLRTLWPYYFAHH